MVARLFSVVFVLVCGAALAQTPVRSFKTLPSSNGYSAVLVDLNTAKVTHFRDHLPATEEPLLDAQGQEVWNGNQPQAVKSRDLLYDAYLGLRSGGTQRWLTSTPIDLDASGYAPWDTGAIGGTGVVSFVQKVGDLEVTTYVFAPRELSQAAFVLAARVRNTGASPQTNVSLFTLHNFHLGFGRPGVMQDLGETGETVVVDSANGRTDLLERAFAGVVATRSLGQPAHVGAWNASSPPSQNGFFTVENGGTANLADVSGAQMTANGWAHAFQFDFGTLAAGAQAWAGITAAHHPDPFAGAAVQSALDAWLGGRSAQAVVEDEIAAWRAFQLGLELPDALSADEEALTRQSAAIMAMAQVREEQTYLREWLTTDGEPRYTRFTTADGGTTLPGVVRHRGKGAVLASLPPGEWTYAWPRDGAYAVAAMAHLGMQTEAAEGLRFYLQADSGRLQNWNELKPYGMPPYLISLTRYHGFGVEETDFNDFGPNLEFDGFGLFLWALGQYERATGDTALADGAWEEISTKVADPIVALIDPATGLLRPDSSIWETHWNGRQRTWTYTNLTAARGLCDAAEIADRVGDTTRAAQYRAAANGLRHAIATKLTDAQGALASNREELQAGAGYFDAAVLDAIAMGLFDPDGRIARATLDAMDAKLRTAAGKGWSRNDDAVDHANANDLSPWGSEYDRAEWVITDLRGAVAMQRAGRTQRAAELRTWVLQQSARNYGVVAETYDEVTAAYKFNAPMIGFGAGAWVLALAERAAPEGPACGAYHDESAPPDAGTPDAGTQPDAGRTDAGSSTGGSDAGTAPEEPAASCGCNSQVGALSMTLAFAVMALGLRKRARRR